MSDVDSASYKKEYFLQDNICRFCWSKDAMINCTLKSPFFFKVEYCLNIDLSQDDSEHCPKKVCQDCYHKIEQFHAFKTFCQNANEKLHKILNNDLYTSACVIEISPVTVKEEVSANFAWESKEFIHDFIDSPQSIEPSLEHFLASPKSPKKYSDVIPCTKKEENAIPLNKLQYSEQSPTNIQNTVDNSKKRCLRRINSRITTKKAKSTIKNNKKTTETLKTSKLYYRRKKCSTYCNICCENFLNQDAFTIHNSEAHGIEKDGKFKCFGCGKLHGTRKARLGHEAQFCKGLQNGYKCSLCNRHLPRRGVYEKHMRDHRLNKVVDLPEDTVFKCSKCMEKFTNKADWKVHMEGHAPKKNYVCETCGKVFSRLDYLNKHNVTHTGDRRYVCPHCGFRSSQKASLTIHIRKHTDERPYPCDLCPQRCASSSNLRAHRRRHLGLNSFQCAICNKKFGYKLSLKEHIAITHERSQSYPCPHCGSVYARKKGLKRHVLSKHAGETSDGTKEIKDGAQNTSVVLYPNAGENLQAMFPNANDKNAEGKVYCIEIKVI